MIYKGIELCCPHCRGDLNLISQGESTLECLLCGRSYPVILDIPDLRIFPDPYIDVEADREKGRKLAEHFDEYDFEGLVGYYYEHTQVVPPQHAKLYTRGLLSGVARANSVLLSWGQHIRRKTGSAESFLEIGCGTAPLLVAAAPHYKRLVGVDIAFRWLVVGKKRLAEAGLDIPLICACAEALPFPNNAFDYVAAESTVEHLRDQKKALKECRRVTSDHGVFCLSTANKFSLGPDPQTGIFAGGYLPDRMTAGIVKRQGGIPPKRNLLSKWSLSHMLKEVDYFEIEIFLADIPAAQIQYFPTYIRMAVNAYHALKRLPGGEQFLEIFGPMLYAVAFKDSASSHSLTW